jgi:hypothetical protein
MSPATQLLHDQMKFAESQAEGYKQQDFEDVRDCHVLEVLLRIALHHLDEIGNLDNKIRLLVLKGEAETKEEELAAQLYRHWFNGATTILMPLLARMEGKGYQVEGAAEFRNACREVTGILTPDSEFFDCERLAELRDKAIDAHRRGETEDWEVPVS